MDIHRHRRAFALLPKSYHAHIQCMGTTWLGQEVTRQHELYPFATAEEATNAIENAKRNAADQDIILSLAETLAPGEMPQLDSDWAWYLYVHILTHDGTLLQRNVWRQFIHPHADEAEAREAFKSLQHYMLGQGGFMNYAAIVPPQNQGQAIVLADRRS